MARTRSQMVMALVIALLAGVAGCYDDNRATILPRAAQLGPAATPAAPGDTVAVVIDGNYIPFLDASEEHTLSREDLEVCLRINGRRVQADIRAVFELHASRQSDQVGFQPGARGTVVLFDMPNRATYDIPTQITITLPDHEFVRVRLNNDKLNDCSGGDPIIWTTRMTINGVNGSPNPAIDQAGCADPIGQGCFGDLFAKLLEPADQIRLRGKRDPALFYVGQLIGGMQFEISYEADNDCVLEVLSASGDTEAFRATAFVGPQVANGSKFTQQVVLLHDDGFILPLMGGATDLTLVGQGPFISLVVQKDPNPDPPPPPSCVETTSWFELNNLVVTDPSGVEIFSSSTSSPPGIGVTTMDNAPGADPGMVFRMYGVDRG